MKIFDVKIDDYKKSIKKELLQRLKSDSKNFFVVTLNPEILLSAKNNQGYKKIINSADIRINDGIGIQLVSWLKKDQIGARITGANLAKELITKNSQLNQKTGIVFLKEGLSTEQEIIKSLKGLSNIKLLRAKSSSDNLSNLKNCQLILVATGHPRQEKLIFNNLKKLKSAKISMGIGGTLDYWTGRRTRAPEILRKLGLEWLWRMLIQPNRILRIFNALIVFPFLAILENNDRKIKRERN